MSKELCLLCDGEVRTIPRVGDKKAAFYICQNCGAYWLNLVERMPGDTTAADISPQNRHIIAGFMWMTGNRFKSLNGIKPADAPIINIHDIIADSRVPKTVPRKIEYLLAQIYKTSENIADFRIAAVFFKDVTKPPLLLSYLGSATHNGKIKLLPPAFGYAVSISEIAEMLECLKENGFLRRVTNQRETQMLSALMKFQQTYGSQPEQIVSYSLTIQGFLHAEDLVNTNVVSNLVFIAMKFQDENTGDRQPCIDAIRQACAECGYSAGLVDDNASNDGIMDQVLAEIKRSKFVIADYTFASLGAYFEAGFALGTGRPLIRCCDKRWLDKVGGVETALHFDERHNNIIIYENEEDLYRRLINRIRAAI
ncbi:MAG: hypothetical protein LBM87_03385 [Ruminococcus sp.]|jgi:nucleoside 2-deoxyribosyltransferase|nr:hypothetical protein [Ruminococcus sp.]